MIPALDDARRIQRAILHGNFMRRPTTRLSDMRGHKEWLHFCVTTASIDLVVNFSIADDLRTGAPDGAEVGRLVCAVRTTDWDGDVDEFAQDSVRARPGRLGLRLGDSSVCFADGAYRVRAKLRRRPIEVDLVFHPIAIASQINNITLGDGPPLHWFLIPRLIANGTVTIGGERFELRNVSAYHDHNWGYFQWGQDFSWVWGYANANPVTSPWTIAFDRLNDRARTTDFLRGLVLWRGPRQCRVFGGREIRIEEEGSFRPERLFKLPRVMSLLRPEVATDVPERLFGRAESRGDVLEMEFIAEALCQIIAPNDHDLGVTIINEVAGTVTLRGSVGGERVFLDGRGMFEFLGG